MQEWGGVEVDPGLLISFFAFPDRADLRGDPLPDPNLDPMRPLARSPRPLLLEFCAPVDTPSSTGLIGA